MLAPKKSLSLRVTRLQNIPYMRIQVRTNSQTKAEDGGSCEARVREALTLLLLYSEAILRKKPSVLQSGEQALQFGGTKRAARERKFASPIACLSRVYSSWYPPDGQLARRLEVAFLCIPSNCFECIVSISHLPFFLFFFFFFEYFDE